MHYVLLVTEIDDEPPWKVDLYMFESANEYMLLLSGGLQALNTAPAGSWAKVSIPVPDGQVRDDNPSTSPSLKQAIAVAQNALQNELSEIRAHYKVDPATLSIQSILQRASQSWFHSRHQPSFRVDILR